MTNQRKSQHLDIVLAGLAAGNGETGLDRIRFEHVALPELDFAAIDLSAAIFGRRIALPFLVSSMTGGPERAAAINRTLAVVCEELSIPLAVGSQRVALEEDGSGGLDASLRALAPSIPILANFGAAQLNRGFGADHAMRAVDAIGADALIIHLNPLQEALQPEGDRDWRGLTDRIAELAARLPVPVVIKEVGAGLSGRTVAALAARGIGVFDVAGSGGTSWAAVEAARTTGHAHDAARAFAGWGIPTATAIVQARSAAPGALIIGSGGIADGVDAARAIRLGADVIGFAGAILPAATEGPDKLAALFTAFAGQLRTVCFCTGSRDLAALRKAALLA